MPNKLPVITGIKDAKTLQRFQNTLKAVGVPKGVTQIIVGNPIQFEQARRAFGIQDSHPAFSVASLGRVYIPDNVPDNPNLIDKYLLHEFGHYAANAIVPTSQQNLNAVQREDLEKRADAGAQQFRDAYKLYQSPQGKVYQSLQSRVADQQDQIQPTPAPIEKLSHSYNNGSVVSAPINLLLGNHR